MPISMKQLKQALECDEPDYQKLAKLGNSAVRHLHHLIKDKSPMLASKAASLATMIGTHDAAKVVEKGAQHKDITVRVAAAHGAPLLSEKDAEPFLLRLLSDRSADVVFRATRAAAECTLPSIQTKLQSLSKRRKQSHIRAAAKESLQAVSSALRKRKKPR